MNIASALQAWKTAEFSHQCPLQLIIVILIYINIIGFSKKINAKKLGIFN